jgi:hypothetical protein
MTLFWVVAQCSLVEVSDVSAVLAASIIRVMITLMMEAVNTSEISVNFYQTAWCNNAEDSHLYIHTSSTVPASA